MTADGVILSDPDVSGESKDLARRCSAATSGPRFSSMFAGHRSPRYRFAGKAWLLPNDAARFFAPMWSGLRMTLLLFGQVASRYKPAARLERTHRSPRRAP